MRFGARASSSLGPDAVRNGLRNLLLASLIIVVRALLLRSRDAVEEPREETEELSQLLAVVYYLC